MTRHKHPTGGASSRAGTRSAARGWVPWAARLAILGITLAAIAAVVIWRYGRFREGLRFFEEAHSPEFLSQDFAPLTGEQVLQLGTAHNPENVPASSYRHFAAASEPGTTRIGVFGCSFTRGAETVDGGDLPSQLERLLTTGDGSAFEAVNFGVGGYGLQQSYLLWQYLGSRFDLDLVVFNLFDFHRERDTTFVQLYDAYGPVHARYVADGDGIGLVEVLGSDRTEAADIYYRPLPPWRYLRYDSKPPPLLRSLLPVGRTLELNPWYYHPDPGEIERLYEAMLSDVRAKADAMLVLCNDDEICATLRGLESIADTVHRVWTTQMSWRTEALYRAPKGHLGAAGNRLAAHELAAIVRGEAVSDLPMVTLRPAAWDAPPLPRAATPRLSECREVYLGVNGEPAAVLVTRDSIAGQTSPFRFDRGGAEFLIDLSDERDVRLLALDTAPPADAPVTVEFGTGAGRRSVGLGSLSMATPFLGRIIASRPGSAGPGAELRLSEGRLELRVPGESAGPVEVRVGSVPLLRSPAEAVRRDADDASVYRLRPVAGAELGARAHPRQPPDLFDGRRGGSLDLVLVDPSGGITAVPLLELAIEPVPIPPEH